MTTLPATKNGIDADTIKNFLAKRDLTLDLIRVVAVLLVVVIHSLLVGVSTTSTGGFAITRPAQAEPWFKYATWIGQIMPLFFIIGGFASWQGWQSTLRKGGNGRDFFRARVLRLVYPAMIWYLIIAIIMWGVTLAGVPSTIVGALVSGLGMPLWFLAAYLICQAAVPLMAKLHTTHPYRTVTVLLAAVIIVDILRYSIGITQIGLFNLLFVWPLMQQLGFFYATRNMLQIKKLLLTAVVVVAIGLVALAGYVGPYSLDMLDNLNPPTLPLVFIGVAHLALLIIFKKQLDALMQKKIMQGAVLFLGARAMSIYLWHLIVVILVSAAVIVFPFMPQAGTSAWWATRPITIAITFAIVILITLGVARFERGPRKNWIGATPSRPASAIVFILAVVPPFWAMEFTMDMWQLLWGTAALIIAVALSLGRHPKTVTAPTHPNLDPTRSHTSQVHPATAPHQAHTPHAPLNPQPSPE